METNNTKINFKGDIGFLFLRAHISFKFRPGYYYKLNQEFIDKYRLIKDGYGRVVSRGKDYIKVEFLKSCPELHHEKGKIVSLEPQKIQDLMLISRGFIKIIFEDLPPIEQVEENDMFLVRLKKPGGNRAESVGSVFRVSEEEAEFLLEEGLIEILPTNYKEPVIPRPVYDVSDWLPVLCLKAHPEYAYSEGQKGIIFKNNIQKLLIDGYFDIDAPSAKEKAKILNELGFQRDPISKKIVRY